MTGTTTGRGDLKFISHSIVAMMVIVDVVTVFGLGFYYVLPVLVAFPQFELTRTVSALGILAFLGIVQVLFLPVIAILLDVPSDHH